MKKLILLLAALPAVCFAQDPCNSLNWNLEKGSFAAAITSPKAPVMASKRVLADDTTMYLTFIIQGKGVVPVSPRGENLQPQVKGLTVVFEDGTSMRNDIAEIDYKLQAGKSIYTYALPIDDAGFLLFTEKKIKQFSLGGLTENSDKEAGSIPEYLRCLQKRKF